MGTLSLNPRAREGIFFLTHFVLSFSYRKMRVGSNFRDFLLLTLLLAFALGDEPKVANSGSEESGTSSDESTGPPDFFVVQRPRQLRFGRAKRALGRRSKLQMNKKHASQGVGQSG